MPPQHRSSRAAREESPHRKPFSSTASPRSVKTAFPTVNTPVLRKPRHNSENQPPENAINNTGKGSSPFGDTILVSPGPPPAKSTPAKGKQQAMSHSLPPRPPSARPSPSTAGSRNVPEAQGNAKRKLLLESPNSGDVASNYATTPDLDTGVKVIVRMRPCNQKEESDEASPIVERLSNESLCISDQQFTFDYVTGPDASQKTIFEIVGVPLVENCLQGLNSSIFAYGQTGSGKTYTMWGSTQELLAQPPSEERGLTPRVFEKLFQRIREEEKKNVDKQLRYQCRCSFLEIYNEQITDLLDPVQKSLQVREDTKVGVYVENLTEEFVSSVEDVFRLILKGLSNRKVASTCMNLESSRSHTLFMCVIESRCKSISDGLSSVRTSRMNLVDLAGSERQKLTGAAGERLKEAGNINRSLSQLGNLINILAEVSQTGKVRHIPYRDSRLTFLLQESLGGNAKLAMICAISPASSCKSETLSTLRFAQRAKSIKNKAVVNEETENDVKLLREQIRQLKDELMRMKSNETSTGDAGSYSTGWNARRSYNLLRMSLSHHPMTLPHSDTDTDEEMEIDEDAVELVDTPSHTGMDVVENDDAKEAKDDFEFPQATANDSEVTGKSSMLHAENVANVQPCTQESSIVDAITCSDKVISEANTDAEVLNEVHNQPTATIIGQECSIEVPSGTLCAVDPPEADEIRKSSEEASGQESEESAHEGSSNVTLLDESAGVDLASKEVDNCENATKDDSSSEVRNETNINSGETEASNLICEDESNVDINVPDCQSLDTPKLSQPIDVDTENAQDVQRSSTQIEQSVYASADDVFWRPSDSTSIIAIDCNTLPAQIESPNSGSKFSTPNVGSQILESNDHHKEVIKCQLNTDCQSITTDMVNFSDISETPESKPPLRSPILSISPYLASDVLEAPILSVSPRLQDDNEKSYLPTLLPPHKLQDSRDKKVPLRSSYCKNKNLSSPTDKLAESLHKGLQILENHQRKDSTNRMSMVNFSFQTLDWEKRKTESVVSKSVQTSPVSFVERVRVSESENVQLLSLEPSVPQDVPVYHVNEAILAAALRRERALEDSLNQKILEIEQLNQLVGQYKHERECNALLQQSRQDKISRLEMLMEGTIPTAAFLSEEWSSLITEHKILQDKYEHHPDVTLVSIREKRLEEELQKYKNFCDLGEKKTLLAEIAQLRDQLESLVGDDANKQRRRSLPPVTKVTVQDDVEVSKSDAIEERVDSGRCSACHENNERWLDREEEWKLVLEELRLEVQEYKHLADKRKRELEGQQRCSDEMKDALQIAMEGHARLLDQYAELQEKHISLLSKHRKVRDAMTEAKKKAGKMGFLGGKFFEAQAAELIAVKMEQEQEREVAREQIEALQAQVRDTADAVQAAGELLVRLKEAEESALIAQDAAALAAEDVEKLCREMDKLKRRHATEVATLQQRLMEARFQKSKVCPMCVMAERAKYEFNGADEQDGKAALEEDGAVASSFGSLQLPTADVDDEPYYYDDEDHELSLQGIDDFHTDDVDDRWYHEDETCNL